MGYGRRYFFYSQKLFSRNFWFIQTSLTWHSLKCPQPASPHLSCICPSSLPFLILSTSGSHSGLPSSVWKHIMCVRSQFCREVTSEPPVNRQCRCVSSHSSSHTCLCCQLLSRKQRRQRRPPSHPGCRAACCRRGECEPLWPPHPVTLTAVGLRFHIRSKHVLDRGPSLSPAPITLMIGPTASSDREKCKIGTWSNTEFSNYQLVIIVLFFFNSRKRHQNHPNLR